MSLRANLHVGEMVTTARANSDHSQGKKTRPSISTCLERQKWEEEIITVVVRIDVFAYLVLALARVLDYRKF
jgi:hypothetical protein